MAKASKKRSKQAKRRAQKRAERRALEEERRPPAEKLLRRIALERRVRHSQR